LGRRAPDPRSTAAPDPCPASGRRPSARESATPTARLPARATSSGSRRPSPACPRHRHHRHHHLPPPPRPHPAQTPPASAVAPPPCAARPSRWSPPRARRMSARACRLAAAPRAPPRPPAPAPATRPRRRAGTTTRRPRPRPRPSPRPRPRPRPPTKPSALVVQPVAQVPAGSLSPRRRREGLAWEATASCAAKRASPTRIQPSNGTIARDNALCWRRLSWRLYFDRVRVAQKLL